MSFAKGTDNTPCHERAWMVLFIFSPEQTAAMASRKTPGIVICLMTICVSTVWWSIPTLCSEMPTLLLDKVNRRLLFCAKNQELFIGVLSGPSKTENQPDSLYSLMWINMLFLLAFPSMAPHNQSLCSSFTSGALPGISQPIYLILELYERSLSYDNWVTIGG